MENRTGKDLIESADAAAVEDLLAERKALRHRNFLVYPDGEVPMKPRRVQLAVNAVPERVDTRILQGLLDKQEEIMRRAIDDVKDFDVQAYIKEVAAEAEAQAAVVATRPPCSSATPDARLKCTLGKLADTLSALLQRSEWQKRIDSLQKDDHELAFVVTLPKDLNAQMFSRGTFKEGEIVWHIPTATKVTIAEIAKSNTTVSDYLVRFGDNEVRNVLPTNIRKLSSDETENKPAVDNTKVVVQPLDLEVVGCRLQGSVPLLPLEPLNLPATWALNLHTHPNSCIANAVKTIHHPYLPTGRDLNRCLQASLFYEGPVVEVVLAVEGFCIYSFYPSFIAHLQDRTPEYRQTRIDVMKVNNGRMARKQLDDQALQQHYEHLLAPGKSEGVSVIHLSIHRF